MDTGETYEKAPRLAPTRPFSHAWPVWQGVQRRWLARLERRAVSAHAVPTAERANQGSEFAALGSTIPAASGADSS
jgi:hypothetical protein